MSLDDQLDELLLAWDERRRTGEDVTAADLTRDCPHLTEPLEKRIAALEAMDWLESADGLTTEDRTHLTSLLTGETRVEMPETNLTSDELLDHLSHTELLTDEEVNVWRDRYVGEAADDDARKLASRLIDEGKITPYQASILLQGQTDKLLIDKYLILDSIDAGGMGIVFKALHRPMNRVVALKILSPHLMSSPEKVQRFRREVQVAASLNHSNVVTAYDGDESKGVHFLVTEYVQGQDLNKIVAANGPLSVDQAVDCILQAARGLAYAHQKGVVHRDVKPSNVMLSGDGAVKVLDLGLARMDEGFALIEQGLTTNIAAADDEGQGAAAQEDDHLTAEGSLMGTVAYMAPEQAADTHTADHRADIYSLGCTLYYLLVGEPPYGGDNPIQTLLAHHEQPVPSLRTFRPDVPAELDDIFQKMLAKKPEDRQRSMGEVITALEALETVSPHPPKVATNPSPQTTRRPQSDAAASDDAATVLQDSSNAGDERPHTATASGSPRTHRPTSKAITTAVVLLLVVAAGLIWNALPKPDEPVGVTDNQQATGDALRPSASTAVESLAAKDRGESAHDLPAAAANGALRFDGRDDNVSIPSLTHDGGTIDAVDYGTDREVAEYVLNRGGEVAVQLADASGKRSSVQVVEHLPTQGFRLTGVFFNDPTIDDAVLAVIARATNIEQVILNATAQNPMTHVTDDGLRHLGSLQRLTRLNLTGEGITDAGLQHLTRLTELRILKLALSSLSGGGLVHLKELPNLEVLMLLRPPLTDTEIPALCSLRTLRSLQVDATRVAPAGMQRLREALPDCFVSEQGKPYSRIVANYVLRDGGRVTLRTNDGTLAVADAADLPADEELTIIRIDFEGSQWGNVQNQILGTMFRLNALESLSLKNTGVGYVELTRYLAQSVKYASLTAIDLRGTVLSKMNPLPILAADRFPALKTLDIRDSGISEANVALLHQAHPNCKIIWDGGTIEPVAELEPLTREAAVARVLEWGGEVWVLRPREDIVSRLRLVHDPSEIEEPEWDHLGLAFGLDPALDDREFNRIAVALPGLQKLVLSRTSVTSEVLPTICAPEQAAIPRFSRRPTRRRRPAGSAFSERTLCSSNEQLPIHHG